MPESGRPAGFSGGPYCAHGLGREVARSRRGKTGGMVHGGGLLDTGTTEGRLVVTAMVVVGAGLLGSVGGRLAARRRADDPSGRYWSRKIGRYVAVLVAVIAVAVVWQGFAGRAGEVLGLMAAGIAFAMQEVIGALAGWVNIVSGRVFRVGDRIEMGGVAGDVIDVTPLRTKIMEIGSPMPGASWVEGRQYTGRIVAVSNKATFTDPVFNSSAGFEFIWDELSVPVPHDADWQQAERILAEEAARISDSRSAQAAMAEVTRRYPVPRTEVEPRVFVRTTSNWMELTARFVVPVRTARSAKSAMTREVMHRLDQAGIPIASSTQDVTVYGVSQPGHDKAAGEGKEEP